MKILQFRKNIWLPMLLVLLLSLIAISAGAAPVATADGVPLWPDNPDWQSYVPGPSSDDVKPVTITRAHGGVTNPEALITGEGSATLTMEEGGEPAVIVLDYGQNHGGYPYLDVSSVSGMPSVRISTSEALPFINTNQNTTLAADAAAGATNVKVASTSQFYTGTEMTVGMGEDAQTVMITDVGSPATPATPLVLPAESGDTFVYLASVDGLAAGALLTIGTGEDAQTVTISEVGTAAGAPTTIVYPALAGDTNVKVGSSAGFAVGDLAIIGSGDDAVTRTVSEVGTAAATTQLLLPASAGDTNVKVTSVDGLTVGAAVDIDPGPSQETVTITNVGTAAVTTTITFFGPSAGDTQMLVSSISGFEAGEVIAIGSGATQETRTVESVEPLFGSFGFIRVTEGFEFDHSPNELVVNTNKPGTGVDFAPALASDHDAFAILASPGTGITFTEALDADLVAGTAIRGAGSGVAFTPALSAGFPAGTTASSLGTGVSFAPALTAAHAAGETVSGLGTYTNDNGGQINFNNISSPDMYTGSLRGGFRFEAIELRTPGTVELSGAGLDFAAYRATPAEYEGWFVSSDDELNRMWYAGAYTAQLDMVPVGVADCFDKPVIFDGAKRDRAIWSGDLIVSDPVALLSLGSNAAPYVTGSVDAFMDIQAADGRLTSAVGFRGCGGFDYAVTYSHYAAMIAIQYYRYTGDTAYIEGLLPNLRAATAYGASRLNENGLIVTNDNDYWQTRQTGEVTEYNLAYYEFLQDMIWLESHVGTQEMVDQYTADAAALKDAINEHLFNEEAGLYQHTDSRPDIFPLDANMNAVKTGVAPADRVQFILDYFKDAWVEHGSEISQPSPSMTDPYGHTIEPLNNTWEMLARLRSDDAEGALELMRRLWGLQVDTTTPYYTNTFWEFVMSDGFPDRGFDSLAHAWGAGPTWVLTEAMIGATAVEPGYEVFQVKPQPVDIEWAQGQVPTAFGPMRVKWAQNTATGMFHLEVTAPEGSGGEVWVPVGSAPEAVSAVVAGDATLLRRDGEYDVYSVGAGTFEFLTVNFESLKDLVSSFSSKPGVANALNSKLDAAAAATDATTRDNILGAFINQVNSQSGKALTLEEANLLVLLAEALMM